MSEPMVEEAEVRAVLGDGGPVEEAKPAHRPNGYTREIGLQICELVGRGVPMRLVIKDPRFPANGTIYRWRRENPEFDAMFRDAKQQHLECLNDDILLIGFDREADKDGDIDYGAVPKGHAVEKDKLAHIELMIREVKVRMVWEATRVYHLPAGPVVAQIGDKSQQVLGPGAPGGENAKTVGSDIRRPELKADDWTVSIRTQVAREMQQQDS